MSSHHPPRHCFTEARFYAAEQVAILHFTEGELYRYPNFTLADWLQLKSAVHHGKTYNALVRRPNRVLLGFDRQGEFAPGADDTFYN